MKSPKTIILGIIAVVFFAIAGCGQKAAEPPVGAQTEVSVEQVTPPPPAEQTTPPPPVGQAAPPSIEAPAAAAPAEAPVPPPGTPAAPSNTDVPVTPPTAAPVAPAAAVVDQAAPPPVAENTSSPAPDEQGSQQQGRFDAIDQLLSKLAKANIAFNTPRSMMLEDTANIQLLLSFGKEIDQLKQMLNAEGEKQGASIRVSDIMEARLSGSNFEITAIGSETQCISRSEVTEWKWDVKPIKKGAQNLHLTMTAVIDDNGKTIKRDIRTFDRVIDVEVVEPTLSDRVSSFIGENWQWLWATLLVPGAGWLWARLKSGKGKSA